jgi:hypothetical protein
MSSAACSVKTQEIEKGQRKEWNDLLFEAETNMGTVIELI